MATKLGRAMEPRVIMQVLTCAVEKVVSTDHLLMRTWWDKVREPSLRNPQSWLDVDDACENNDWG
eukprot:10175631-Prorocentrum_lima.AAC.1